MKLGQNTSRDKKYVRTFKAVEAGVYYVQDIEAGECTYLGLFWYVNISIE